MFAYREHGERLSLKHYRFHKQTYRQTDRSVVRLAVMDQRCHSYGSYVPQYTDSTNGQIGTDRRVDCEILAAQRGTIFDRQAGTMALR